jgi:hypothetical protein
MDATVFVRVPNSTEYNKLGAKTFSVLPRVDEYVSAEWQREKRFFQVVAIHHATDKEGLIELYAVQSEPPWEIRKSRAIGFGPSGK